MSCICVGGLWFAQRSKVLAATPGEGCVFLRVSVQHEDNKGPLLPHTVLLLSAMDESPSVVALEGAPCC